MGWSAKVRRANRHKVAADSRFLLLTDVRVAHLASKVLVFARRTRENKTPARGRGLETGQTSVSTSDVMPRRRPVATHFSKRRSPLSVNEADRLGVNRLSYRIDIRWLAAMC